MAKIYSSSNRIRFTDIPEKYAIPRNYKGKQCEVHSAVITYVFEHFKDTKKYKQRIVDTLNCLTYCIIEDHVPPMTWKATDPLETLPDMDMDSVNSSLGDLSLSIESIDWDVQPTDDVDVVIPEQPTVVSVPVTDSQSLVQKGTYVPSSPAEHVIPNRPLKQVRASAESQYTVAPTPKEDLYIQPPRCPRFDYTKIWMAAPAGGDNLVIYTTLPEIPTKQNEISVTTDIQRMTSSEFMSLFPNRVIHTRSPKMYDKYEGLDYDDQLGCIIPISGFTKEEVIDNIIRYPHLYRLRKIGPDGSIQKFVSTIEIDGEILNIEDVWDDLPEAAVIPRDAEFAKEYVVRRYILEEEKGIHHTCRMFGSLDPFLTLFMPPQDYIKRGYKDTTAIAKQCVMSRIRYKQTRNPVLRRMEQNV